MGMVVSQITSLTIVYSTVYSDADIKAPCHWPLCGEFTRTGEFPPQMVSNKENVPIWWRYHAAVTLHTALPWQRQNVHQFCTRKRSALEENWHLIVALHCIWKCCLVSTGHHQLRFSPGAIGMFLSSLRVNLNNLRCFSIAEWYKRQIYSYVFSNNWAHDMLMNSTLVMLQTMPVLSISGVNSSILSPQIQSFQFLFQACPGV